MTREEDVTDRSVYEFGDVRVDCGRVSITRAGAPISLEPKAFDVLVFLIAHRDRVVTRDELLDTVWAATFVTPNVLTRAVAQIRRVLGEQPENPFIETIAKRGYRFVAPVTLLSGDPSSPAAAGAAPPASSMPTPLRAAGGRRLILIAVVCLAGIGAGMFWYGRMRGSSPPAGDLHLRRLTSRRGYNGTPALSPDGRAIVYASDVSGRLELYLATLTEGSAEVPLTSDDGQNVEPAWSPDAQWIAFHSGAHGGVWIVPSTGGVPRQVATFGSDPAWSPDSETIVFTSDAGGMAAQSSLWTVRRDGSDRRPLTHLGTPVGGHRAPGWSHDGRRVAFLRTDGTWMQEIWTVDVATGATRKIAASTAAADPAFATDDRSIYWGGTTQSGNGRLFRQDLDAKGEPIGDVQVVVPLDAGTVEGVTIGANNTLAFSLVTLDANLWTIAAGSGAHTPAVRLTDDVARDTMPDCSARGHVVFLQTAIGAQPSVWMTGDEGSGRAPLLPGTPAGDPQWEAGGRRVLVERGTPDNKWELVWVDVATRSLTRTGMLIDDMFSVRLSPDGVLAFHRLEPNGGLSVWTTTMSGTRTRVATDPEAVSYPAWSPDGRWLAVELKRGDTTQIGVVARQGGAVTPLTDARGQNWPNSWAPDNDNIVFAGERGGVWNVYTVSRTTRAVVALTNFSEATGYVRYPSWCAGTNRVVFERGLESASVWTLALPETR